MKKEISKSEQGKDAQNMYWAFINFNPIVKFMEIFKLNDEMNFKKAMKNTGKQREQIAILFGVTKHIGLLESPRRGRYLITDIGRKFLAANKEERKRIFCELIKKFNQFLFAQKEYKRNPKITGKELGEIVAIEYQREWNDATRIKNARILLNWIEMYEVHTRIERRTKEIKDFYKEIGILETYIKTERTQDEIEKELQKLLDIAESFNLGMVVSIINLMRKHLKMEGIKEDLLLSDLETLHDVRDI